jgi:serine/threonine protein kinase
LYDYIDGEDLSKKNVLSQYPKTASSFLNFAQGLTRAVQLIHNNGVLHSFLVPRNIIKSKKQDRYTIVGFGYSSFCDSRHHAPPLKVSDTDRCYRAPECTQMENLGALWLPVDIYSIGAILYQLATGNIPNKVEAQLPRDVNRLKEHIYDKLSDRKSDYEKPSKLFTDNENILKILDRCLRFKPEDRFSCAEELIETLEIAEQATGVPAGRKGSRNVGKQSNIRIHEILVDIASKNHAKTNLHSSGNIPTIAAATKPTNLNHLFDSLLKGWADKAVEDAERMQRGHHEIYGHRDVLVTSLCRLLAGAKNGNIYRTMTLPSYWTDNNLGSNGRFLTMNKHMARQGLKIERIFLVNKPFHELTEREQEILEFQLEAERNVNKRPIKGTFKVMVKEIKNEKELTDFETNGTLVAYLESSDAPDHTKPVPKNCLCLNFVSHGHYEWLNGRKMIEHSIKKVRYWIPKDDFRKQAFETSQKAFNDKWQNAISLEEYIGKNTATTLEELLSKGKKFTANDKIGS